MIDWVLIGAALGLPFAIMGVIFAGTKAYEHILLRKGYIKAHFMKENFQIAHQFVKPIDKAFKLKIGDVERQFPFSNVVGDCLYDGNQPFVVYNEKTGEQISFNETEREDDLSSHDKSVLLMRHFNLGFNLGKLQSDNKEWLLYVAAIAAGLTVIGVFVMYTNFDPILKDIAAKVATMNMPVIK